MQGKQSENPESLLITTKEMINRDGQDLTGPTARPPIALQGIAKPIVPLCFSGMAGYRAITPRMTQSQPREQGGSGIADHAALCRLSRYTGVSLR